MMGALARACVGLVAPVLLLLACASTDSPPPKPAPTIEEAAALTAERLCALQERCELYFYLDYPDLETCVARRTVGLTRNFFSEGSDHTAEQVIACSTSFDPSDCEAYHRVNTEGFPPACEPLALGTLPV